MTEEGDQLDEVAALFADGFATDRGQVTKRMEHERLASRPAKPARKPNRKPSRTIQMNVRITPEIKELIKKLRAHGKESEADLFERAIRALAAKH